MKKFVTLLLALALCLGLAIPAAAVTTETIDGVTITNVIRKETRTLPFAAYDGGNRVTEDKTITIYYIADGAVITTSDELAGNFGYTLTDGAYEQSGGGQIGSQWTESESNAWAELYELATSATEQAVFYAFDNGSIPAVEEAPAEETPAEEAPAEPAEDVVVPSNQALQVNGEAVTGAQVYNINGSNYFKLRDVAALLSGTGSQFALEYDAAARQIVLTTGEAYTPDGSELTAGEDQSATAVRSSQSLTIDGEAASLTAYNIGGNNYFMLRDLGEALGFEVDYDAATRTMIVNSAA